ncbi:MAG: MBL fold metallo-hydrolase [Treponema sp.]|nr:MBL fold metallo-hydrolase [Treponema sp.]
MQETKIKKLIVGPISTNCWIYPLGGGEAAVIDPGDEADKIIFTLKKLELTPKYILLTHGHFDHIIAVPELIENYDKKPQIAIHRLDSSSLGPGSYEVHKNSIQAAFGDPSFLDVYWNEMPPADILLEEGTEIGPFITLHVPGHTPGSAAFWDKNENVLFTGDTLFANAYGRTDLPGGNDKQMIASIKRLFAMDGAIKVYPGHGEITTILKESRD